MEADIVTTNVTFHPQHLYWVLLLQSNVEFMINSINLSSSAVSDSLSVLELGTNTSTKDLGYDYQGLMNYLTHACLEDFSQQLFLGQKSFYCYNSVTSFSHQIIGFQPDFPNPSFVSI